MRANSICALDRVIRRFGALGSANVGDERGYGADRPHFRQQQWQLARPAAKSRAQDRISGADAGQLMCHGCAARWQHTYIVLDQP